MHIRNLLLAAVIGISFQLSAADPVVIPSSLKSVTVYRSGAEMVHSSTASLPGGNQDLVIEGISNMVDVNSIQINCPAAVTIMGVEYAKNHLVSPEVTSRIKMLRDSASRMQKELDKTNVQIQTLTDLLEVLKANRDIKGEQTGLSVAELVKLMDYYKKKSIEIQNDLSEERERQKKINEMLAKLRNQVREEESRNTKTVGQLRLQLSVAAAGSYNFNISYISMNASWSPYYDVRVDDIKSPLKLIYKAKISQTTGIDWKKVKLALSTSVPNQWGNAPILNTWFLSYINPVVVMNKAMARNSIQSMNDDRELNEVVVSGIKIRGTTNINNANGPLYVVNGTVMSADEFSKIDQLAIKSTQVLKGESATALYGSRGSNGVILVTLKDGMSDYVSVSDNELNVSFDIELPYDVPTTGKEQTATLKEYSVPALYKYYSVPKLDKDAYLLAEVADWEKLNLLPGEANIIFEGTYVGKSFIDPASTMDTLNLTLGKDKRVVVKKEKLMDYSSVKFLGTNKLQKFTYEITVKNNKKDTVKMLLKDQYPISTNKDIEVELIEDGKASINNTDIGVLSWKLELAPGEVKKIRIVYSVKYPKDKVLNLN